MTDEQIKQNAEAYASYFYPRNSTVWQDRYNAYIAGAHSRDEEIKELNGQVTLHKDRADYYHDIYMKLRNPWISVKDRLPERTIDEVICKTLGGSTYLCFWDGSRWCSCHHDLIAGATVTHWMPIPELKKGE